MLLLTWHGTILRVEQSQKRLVHVPLVPADVEARDLSFTDTLPGGLELHPGPHAGAFHIRHGEETLRASADSPFPVVEAAPATPDACVLPILEAEAAALRALLSAGHRHVESLAEVAQATLEAGFMLAAGPDRLNLVEGRPVLTEAGIVLPGGAGTLVGLDAPWESLGVTLLPAKADDSITVVCRTEKHFLPVTDSFSARDWFYGAATEPPLTGTHSFTGVIQRAENACLLTFDGEDIVFTRRGVVHGRVPAAAEAPFPAGMVRHGDRFFIANTALAAAPRLAGPHARLPPGGDHPMLQAVLPLVMMMPHVPPDTALLQPVPAAEILALFGLGGLPLAVVAAPLCGVETLFWPATDDPLGADVAQAARDRAHAVRPPPENRRSVFITEGLGNVDRLNEIAALLNFETVQKVPSDAAGRAWLFAGARAVIAASGPLLENALFCLPGTHIIELSPASAWNGRYARLSDQLGLVHAALPSPLEDGVLVPNAPNFRRLLRILQARL